MAEKQGLSLTQVLEDFQSSLKGEQQTKQAEVEPEPEPKQQELSTSAVSSLKEIAKTASEQNEKNMTKEAEEFGKIFAHSFMQELQTSSDLEKAASEAYEAMTEKIASEQLTQVYDEAYMQSMAKVAGEFAYKEAEKHLQLSDQDINNLLEITKEAYQVTGDALNNG